MGKLLPFPANFIFLIYVSSALCTVENHHVIYRGKHDKCNAKINQGRKYSPWKNFALCESHFTRCTVLPTDNLLQLLRITQAAVSLQISTYSSPWQLQQGLSWEKHKYFCIQLQFHLQSWQVFPMEMLQSHLSFFQVLFNFL